MLASLTRLEFGALTAAMLLAPNLVASSSLFGSLAQVKGSAYRHARALDVSINLAHAKRQLGGSSNSTYFTPVGASNSSCTTCVTAGAYEMIAWQPWGRFNEGCGADFLALMPLLTSGARPSSTTRRPVRAIRQTSPARARQRPCRTSSRMAPAWLW